MISSKTDCENAATEMNLYETQAVENKYTSRPTGCILDTNTFWLGYNNDTNNDVPCGSIDSENTLTPNSYKCICKKRKYEHL